MKTRLLHLAALVLGALTIALALLEKLPKYAAVAGSLLLVIANVEKMSPALVDAIKKIFPSSVTPAGLLGILVARSLAVFALLAVVTAAGCSLLNNIGKSCEPTKADEAEVVSMLAPANFLSLLEQYALEHRYCVVDGVVATYVSSHSIDAGAAGKAEESVEVQHGRTWLAARTDGGAK